VSPRIRPYGAILTRRCGLKKAITAVCFGAAWIGAFCAWHSFKASAEDAPSGELVEPPLEFHIEDGRKTIPVELNRPFSIETQTGPVSLTLRVEPHRTFHHASIRFRYPSSYTFEAKIKDPMSTWTMSGNDAKVILFRHRDLDPDEWRDGTVKSMLKKYDRAGQKLTKTKTKLGRHVFAGTQLRATVAGTPMLQEVYTFVHRGAPFLLILQDSPAEADHSNDYLHLIEMLRSSFELTE
jgi:hypothetical protein